MALADAMLPSISAFSTQANGEKHATQVSLFVFLYI